MLKEIATKKEMKKGDFEKYLAFCEKYNLVPCRSISLDKYMHFKNNSKMSDIGKNVLILFERSGAVSIPFSQAGFNVTTIDIYPHLIDNTSHIIHDIRKLDELKLDYSKYCLLVAFPPCTYFSKAGLHYLRTQPGRKEKQLNDLDMVKKLWQIPIKCKCFENPAGSALNKLFKPHSCRIDYSEFADFKKKTDLWLDNLPPLIPEQINLKKYGSFITKMNYKSFDRCYTPMEVGFAMVNQWSNFI